jgi:hypothetical protein
MLMILKRCTSILRKTLERLELLILLNRGRALKTLKLGLVGVFRAC